MNNSFDRQIEAARRRLEMLQRDAGESPQPTAANITARKQAEEALRTSEARLASVVDIAALGLYELAEDERVSYADNRLRAILGIPGELDGVQIFEFWADHLYPDDRQRILSLYQQLKDGRQARLATEYRYVHPQHGRIWVSNLAHVIERNAAGQAFHLIGVFQDITERKRAEQALRESEIRFRALSENALAGVYIVQDGHLTYVNESFATISGYLPDELIGADPLVVIHPDDQALVTENIRRRMAGEIRTIQYECRGRRKNGATSQVEIFGVRIDLDERPALIGTVTDITARKRAEMAMAESQAQTRAIVDSTVDLIWSVDAEHFGLLIWNRSFQEYFLRERGIAVEIGMRPEDLFPAGSDYIQQWRDFYGRALAEGPYTTEYGVYTGTRILRLSLNLLQQNGCSFGVSVFGKDITQHKRAEEALRASEARLASAVDIAALGLCEVADSNRVSYADNRLRAILGIPGEVDGVQLFEFWANHLHPDDRQRILSVSQALSEGREDRVATEYRYLHPQHGLRWVYTLSHVIERNAAGQTAYRIVIFQDITERKQAEEELAQSREQLRNLAEYLQSVREQQRTSIAREIHDDFGQTLTALKIDLAWLFKRLPPGLPDLGARVEAMSALMDGAIHTVQRIATELRPGVLDDLGLVAAIEWQTEEFARRTGIACTLRLGDHDPALEPDLATALFRILQEALTNIVRHAEAAHVEVELDDQPGLVTLVVRDDGKGIEPAQLSDPHSLGLIGMRERVRAFGGDFVIQGRTGMGTTVTVQIPTLAKGEERQP